ncbi:MAG: enoyl-CoA hydratase/isomerase family protein, partial [Rhodospirillales bacterium]|nr:enoyl-CoA hydratase/isomerase family protein [Rhodospirillales bacterium]
SAERIGLVDHVVASGTVLDAALQRAAGLAEAAPLPIAMTKAFLAQGLAASLDWERNAQSTLFLTGDHAEGKAAFLAKRAPRFSGV